MSRKIKLVSSDGETFEAEAECLKMSNIIKTILEDHCPDESHRELEPVSMRNVKAVILKKVIQWCEYHYNDPPMINNDRCEERRSDDINTWDAEFLKVDQGTLCELILAAHYLKINGLLDMACKTVANMIKGKTPEEIRRIFHIKNDFTPEEEEQIRRENAWCEE